MDILGIGPLELLFILLIALIILGPKDMVRSGRVIGKYLRQIVTSPTWRLIQDTSREIRNMPNRLIREAGMEEFQQDLRETARQAKFPELQNKIGGGANLEPWVTPAVAAGDSSPPTPDPNQDGQVEPSHTEEESPQAQSRPAGPSESPEDPEDSAAHPPPETPVNGQG